MGLQLSAEKRLKDSRDTVNEVLERGDPRREDAIRTLLDVADVQPGSEALLLASTARSSKGEARRGRRSRGARWTGSPTTSRPGSRWALR